MERLLVSLASDASRQLEILQQLSPPFIVPQLVHLRRADMSVIAISPFLPETRDAVSLLDLMAFSLGALDEDAARALTFAWGPNKAIGAGVVADVRGDHTNVVRHYDGCILREDRRLAALVLLQDRSS